MFTMRIARLRFLPDFSAILNDEAKRGPRIFQMPPGSKFLWKGTTLLFSHNGDRGHNVLERIALKKL